MITYCTLSLSFFLSRVFLKEHLTQNKKSVIYSFLFCCETMNYVLLWKTTSDVRQNDNHIEDSLSFYWKTKCNESEWRDWDRILPQIIYIVCSTDEKWSGMPVNDSFFPFSFNFWVNNSFKCIYKTIVSLTRSTHL